MGSNLWHANLWVHFGDCSSKLQQHCSGSSYQWLLFLFLISFSNHKNICFYPLTTISLGFSFAFLTLNDDILNLSRAAFWRPLPCKPYLKCCALLISYGVKRLLSILWQILNLETFSSGSSELEWVLYRCGLGCGIFLEALQEDLFPSSSQLLQTVCVLCLLSSFVYHIDRLLFFPLVLLVFNPRDWTQGFEHVRQINTKQTKLSPQPFLIMKNSCDKFELIWIEWISLLESQLSINFNSTCSFNYPLPYKGGIIPCSGE